MTKEEAQANACKNCTYRECLCDKIVDLDRFAAQAMTLLPHLSDVEGIYRVITVEHGQGWENNQRVIDKVAAAKWCYQFAEAMHSVRGQVIKRLESE